MMTKEIIVSIPVTNLSKVYNRSGFGAYSWCKTNCMGKFDFGPGPSAMDLFVAKFEKEEDAILFALVWA